ncbi:MAG: class I SAM-dependent methyltransferase [Phycisphaerae bacterium]|nr:class I SAM-dependent methyltransferase [Phycisphaerae bacterium]
MDDQLLRQQQRYDEGWRYALSSGHAQRGNLQTNLEFLTRTNLLRPGDKILEIGCGVGLVVAELTRLGYDIVGTDLSREAIAHGLAEHPGLRLEVQPAEDLSFAPGTFDVVLSFDLFEHIARIDRHVQEVRRVLKPHGSYLFQTPNKISNTVFETVAHRSLEWRWAHPSLHTAGQLRRRMQKHGFDVEFIKMNPVNEFTVAKVRRKLGPLAGLYRRVPFTRLPLRMQTDFYVVARKRP